MKPAIRKSIIRTIFVLAICAGVADYASAQHGYRVTKRITFKKGEVGTTVSGTIPNTLESHEYIVRARKGQTILVDLHTTTSRLGFYIMSPSDSMVEEEPFLKHYTGELRESGDYHIFVYTEKGSGKYSLKIQVASDI